MFCASKYSQRPKTIEMMLDLPFHCHIINYTFLYELYHVLIVLFFSLKHYLNLFKAGA